MENYQAPDSAQDTETSAAARPWWFHAILGFWSAVIVGAFALRETEPLVIAIVVGVVGMAVTSAVYQTTAGGSLASPGTIDTKAYATIILGACLLGLISRQAIHGAELAPVLIAVPALIMWVITVVFSKKHHKQ